MRAAFFAYGISALIGAFLAITLFPLDFLVPQSGQDWRAAGDAAQHAIAQRHFLADAWRWPILRIETLGGANLAFMDGIPALALPLKLLAPLLPEGFHGIGLFYALAWVGQAVVAVFALRGFGERRVVPSLAVAVMALSMPAFVMRFGHAALTGHFVILLALGLYARVLGDARWWAAAIPFHVLALLVHPYLALMALALLAAAPLTLLLRGEAWRGAALGAAGAAGAMGATMALLGYLGAEGDGGFGQYAMNLLSPFWPHRSWFLGQLVSTEVDATGHGGWEGYNWLGLGLILAVGAGLMLRPARIGRHWGLVLALLGLTALAVSFRVGLGREVILDLRPVPEFLEQFRASGRFFWPVAYALLIGAALLLRRAGPRGIALLCVCAAAQFLDAIPARAALRAWAHERAAWSVDASALRPLLREAETVTLLPSWPCVPREDWMSRVRLLELLLLASETPRPVNTAYVARWRTPPRCEAPAPMRPGELRIALPGTDPAASGCVALGDLTVCRP
ncbi:DUF6311 domain-containing protein [Sabulicella rubraurantiaca]|uniref:DUF6311 domain-containing protein n=1 Tax=Sabulicella rubraurantiaca TaxID=2811429 RepID=UPI001A95CA3B|nr:DUF6311 domain-containing protein [Sabulicella rubraurantiaca]